MTAMSFPYNKKHGPPWIGRCKGQWPSIIILANSNHSDAMSTSNPNKLISKADKLTKPSLTRWSADWKSATVLYEQAGNAI
ncbi:hypothetical protein SCA6_019056 [Theobroma cacao]